jgi:hypothetical protein
MAEIMRDVLSKGMSFRFSAGGFSMSPFIKNGDIISVSPLPSRLPSIGDVVAFIHPVTKLLCIHRVLSRNKYSILVQGDNMPHNPDGMIHGNAVIGRVTLVERRGRRIRFGLGPERRIIAIISRNGILAGIKRYAAPVYGFFKRRHPFCEKN